MRIDPTRIRIRAVVQAATAKATVSAVAFRASVLVPYIRIRTLLGQFLKFFQITDTVGVSEGQTYFAEDYVEPGYVGAGFFINFTKVITDTVGVSELFGFFRDRAVPDSATMTDSAALTFGTSKADSATVSDALTTLAFTKAPVDSVSAADAITAFSASKALADTATGTDSPAFSASKVLADTSSAADAFVASVLKPLSDTASAADASANNFTKIVSDLAALADAAALSASKVLADTSTLADVVAISAGKSIIDTATASDSGSLRMQDYCDFTYFAEDYVGESRTFT